MMITIATDDMHASQREAWLMDYDSVYDSASLEAKLYILCHDPASVHARNNDTCGYK